MKLKEGIEMKKLLIFLLILSGCTSKPLIEDDIPPIVEEETPPVIVEKVSVDVVKHPLDSYIYDWEDELAGVYFIQYGDYVDFDNLIKSSNFSLLLELFPTIDAVQRVQTNLGEVQMMILPRFENTHILIEDDEGNVLLDEEDFNTVLLRCNQSELRPDTKVTLTYQDEEIIFEPFISMMDGRFELPAEILDLSLYPYPKDNLFGAWETYDFVISFEEHQDLFIYLDDIEYEGNYYFEVPIDFKEPFDNTPGMIYFNLINPKDGHQLFAKYIYTFEEDNTLILKHISYDSLTESNMHWLHQPN